MTQVLGIVKEGKLIPEELWVKFVQSLENDFDALETNKERAKRELANAIIQAIKKRVDFLVFIRYTLYIIHCARE